MAMGGVNGKKERWGTWEELVLACAVKRHGTKSWDFVAMEVQTRTSVSSRFVLSANDCREKYKDLKRRFGNGGDGEKGGEEKEEKEEEEEESEGRIPWLEELRKIRVDELRREVERYDVSIVSLQVKLKKLKEDRDRTVSEPENGPPEPDPGKEGCGEDESSRSKQEESHHKTDEVKVESTLGNNGTDPATKPNESERLIDESDREYRSFNESNSTEEKPEPRTPEPNRADEAQVDPVASRPVTEELSAGGLASPSESYNGSSETISKDPARRSLPAEGRPTEIGDVYSATKEGIGPSNESSADSKDRNVQSEGTKDSSEGLSSVRPSKKRRTGTTDGSSGDDDERGSDTASAGDSKVPSNVCRSNAGGIASLSDHLDTVRSHRYGRVFERRLDSQGTTHDQSLIRKHVDLEMVGTRVEEGHYASALEFFRDLLLLSNNALVFFPRNSPESVAASKLRELVTKEMMPTTTRRIEPKEEPSPSSDTKEQTRPISEEPGLQPPKPSNPLPVVALSRKRSSLSTTQPEPPAKPPKAEPETTLQEEPERLDLEKGKDTEKETKKPPAKGSRTNKSRARMLATKNNANSSNHQTENPVSNPNRSLMETSAVASKDTGGKKTELKSRKRSAAAANLLNSMKKTGGTPAATASTSVAGSLLETLKNSGGSNGGTGGNQRKGTRECRKESGGRQKKQKTPPVPPPPPRKVGRPPKKVPAVKQRAAKEVVVEAAAAPPPVARTARKRARR